VASGALDVAGSGSLVPALAVSIALHAAVLAGVPDLWTFQEPPAPSPLTAWLAPGAPPTPDPEPQRAAPPQRSAEAAPRPRPPAAKPAPAPPIAPPTVAPEISVPAAPPVVEEAAPAERISVAASAPSPPAASPAPAAPAQSAGEVPPEAGSVAQYRLALIGAAKRHKSYPERAIDRGLEGRVDVRLVIGAEGGSARVLVRRSSGHDVLDRQALELLRKAAAVTPVPPALRHREFAVDVPVLYELKEAR
jgi:protein TonB